MSTRPTTTVRIDQEVKKRATEVFDDIGISMSAGINTFLKAVVREGTMPFEIKTKRTASREKCRNATLNHAFIVKKDEFYTQYEDVAKEMVKHGDKLRGKTVLCNCDDPLNPRFSAISRLISIRSDWRNSFPLPTQAHQLRVRNIRLRKTLAPTRRSLPRCPMNRLCGQMVR